MALPLVATWLRSAQRGVVYNVLPLCPHDGSSPLHHSSPATRMWRQTKLTLLPASAVYSVCVPCAKTQNVPKSGLAAVGRPEFVSTMPPLLGEGGSSVLRAVGAGRLGAQQQRTGQLAGARNGGTSQVSGGHLPISLFFMPPTGLPAIFPRSLASTNPHGQRRNVAQRGPRASQCRAACFWRRCS
jgi:hypothetical protein